MKSHNPAPDFSEITKGILALVDQWEIYLKELDTELISNRQNSQNRTIKQIVGHMIDSASNNTHRIIHLQYQENPLVFPDYANFGNNDRWIAIQNYQSENWDDLIQLWKYSQKHIAHVIHNVNPAKLANEWISAKGNKVSLEDMITDYLRHLKLHLSEIEELTNNG